MPLSGEDGHYPVSPDFLYGAVDAQFVVHEHVMV